MQGLRRNDPDTLRSLYALHFTAVRLFVLQNNGTLDDAQDVFQEAVTALWLNVKEGKVQAEGATDPGGYLFRVAKNKWLDTVRSARFKHMKVMADSAQVHIPVEPLDDTEGRLQRLRTIYAGLDERCRAVLDRFYYEHQDLATIAASMGVEEESIRTIKYRCMMKLRAFRRSIDGNDDNASEE